MGKISSIIRQAAGKKRFCSAVILAAGSGARYSDNIVKQFEVIDGKTVLLRSAFAFEECELVDEIVLVTSSSTTERAKSILERGGITKLTRVVTGGETRGESAKRGFDAVNPACEFVAIHDAARCLVTPQMIESAFDAAFVYGGAACAAVCTDTLKKADTAGNIVETVDRENVWQAQTPQIFNASMYRAAVYYAEKDGITATDDCALCERLGFKIKLVDCGRTNIKITYPEDIAVAEGILAHRRMNGENT